MAAPMTCLPPSMGPPYAMGPPSPPGTRCAPPPSSAGPAYGGMRPPPPASPMGSQMYVVPAQRPPGPQQPVPGIAYPPSIGSQAFPGGAGTPKYFGQLPGEQVPMIPEVKLPPQRAMDGAADDGPVSVSCKTEPMLLAIQPLRPCPQTSQYLHQHESRQLEKKMVSQPPHANDICGWVSASYDPSSPWEANSTEADVMRIHHNDYRLVYQCISGWVLMTWQSQEDFEVGIRGARRAPRPLSWFDLRKAFDVHYQLGDNTQDPLPHLVTIMTHSGNYYFCCEDVDDTIVWVGAIRNVIREAAVEAVRLRDTSFLQRKRWVAACGVGGVLAAGEPLGERALAVLFHAYDIDADSYLRLGEIMMLIQELAGGMELVDGRGASEDRATAMVSARSRFPGNDLAVRAEVFRFRCDDSGDGCVRKDEFIRNGHAAMLEAFDLSMMSTFGDFGAAFGL